MLDLLIVLAFVAYSTTAGFVARRKASRGLADYFLAGKILRGWQAGTSMAATQFAADTPLLFASLVATGGIFMLWRLWVYGLAFLLLGFVFASHWQRARVLTDAELTEIRYSGHGVLALRVAKALYYGTVMNCVVLAMVLIAAVGIAEVFLPWHTWLPGGIYEPLQQFVSWTRIAIHSEVPPYAIDIATTNNIISIICIVVFTALYSMTGGLRSVVATDLMQFALAMIGVIAYAMIIVDHAGGLGGMIGQLQSIYGDAQAERMLSFSPRHGGALLPFLILMSMQWIFQRNSDGTGYLAQRSMACRDAREARLAGVTFAWLQIIVRSIPWLLIAIGLLVVYPTASGELAGEDFKAQREIMFVRGVDDLMPIGLRGVLLTGMLAALASTLDTHMNWGASYWSNDIYKRLINRSLLQREPKGHELVIIARLSNLVILVIALTVMLFFESIQGAWETTLLFGAGVGSVLILRWLWERINLWSEIAAMLVSVPLAVTLLTMKRHEWFGDPDSLSAEAWSLALMSLISTAVTVLAAYTGPNTDQQKLDAFYKQVKPAGLWKQTARRVGDDPKRPGRELQNELITTALTGISLFAVLYGIARLLLPHPDVPTWIPILVLSLGTALVPFWWKRAATNTSQKRS